MFWEKKLAQWVQEVRDKANLPARLVLWDGQQLDFGNFAAPQVTLKVNSASALPLLLEPSLDNLGEAYVKGKIDIEGKLSDIINIGYSLARSTVTNASKLARVRRYFNHTKRRTRKRSSITTTSRTSSTSCGSTRTWSIRAPTSRTATKIWHGSAQEDRPHSHQDPVAARPAPARHRLRLGGARPARRAEVRRELRSVTLSQNQFNLATERVKAAGLSDRIEIRLQDYRDVEGQFDRITSVGMFEHVGRKNLPGYFRKMHDLLTDEGIAMNHGITSSDADSGETSLGGGEFIDRYVFPDGELPHIGLVLESMQRGGLEAIDAESLRRHYAHTLDIWAERFETHAEEARKLVDDEKFRIWRVYLAGCAYAFEHDDVSLFQVVCRKAGRSAATLPWSRRYMYEKPL